MTRKTLTAYYLSENTIYFDNKISGTETPSVFLEKEDIIRDFELPLSIENINFNKQTLPIYNLPAV